MRTSPGLRVPSTDLLRFLKSQLRAQTAHTTAPARTVQPRFHHHSAHSARPVGFHRCHVLAAQSRSQRTGDVAKSIANKHFSTSATARGGWWFNGGRPPPRSYGAGSRDDDLLPLLGLDDSSGLGGRILKPSNELKMRCTEFDDTGNVVLVSGEFKKQELIAKYSLLPRDLRKIDSSVLPSILVRESAILINLLHIRCLIKHNRVLVFDVYGSTDSYAQSLFMYDLEGKLRQKHSPLHLETPLPYEFRALEAVLISVTNGLESEFEGVREPLIRILRDLEEDIDRDKLRHLLIYSKKLSTFEQKARLVRDAIDEILEADDDLADMYLSEKAEGIMRDEDNHDEIELLLESYYNVADEICQISSNLVTSIKNTEDIIRAILDSNRNSLMLLDLKFSVLTLGTTVGMFIAALYGMNLENFIEESHYGFFGISGMCVVLTGAACLWGMKRLRKVQKVRIAYDRGNQQDLRLKSIRNRRDQWRRLDHDMAEHGLGEGGAGAKTRESMQNWKKTQRERLQRIAADQKGSKVPDDGPPVPTGA